MIVVIIPAKGTSGRLLNKNMAMLNGKPMLAYAIDGARRSQRADRIVVSTDSEVIASYCARQHIDVVRRTEALGGEVPLYDVYRHAAEQIGLDRIDVLIGLQPDHPDRTVSVDNALAFFERAGADFLTTTDAEGTKNGSFKIYNRAMLKTGKPKKEVVMVDDCTNVHHASDLERAARNLAERDQA